MAYKECMKQIDEFYLDNGEGIMKNSLYYKFDLCLDSLDTSQAIQKKCTHVHEHMIFKIASQLPVGEISGYKLNFK